MLLSNFECKNVWFDLVWFGLKFYGRSIVDCARSIVDYGRSIVDYGRSIVDVDIDQGSGLLFAVAGQHLLAPKEKGIKTNPSC
jgi:hypothetical protein